MNLNNMHEMLMIMELVQQITERRKGQQEYNEYIQEIKQENKKITLEIKDLYIKIERLEKDERKRI